ncbi:DUF4395 domain-containing protein [Carboxylicivirga sediminis]|uniref:DUF4395 domain-containing protein n=1 Tax=Carboxylicivirga sediminis TaxID=2006564 RepID=A0A941F023_9BACT|nr:DUF4395 domain-containing protein [Carboxylicivirga sediminis]MBR8534513.1 DUF4395 domain-containing protein [Carboxylicivirga sediminis]
MAIFSFGEYKDDLGYKVVDERVWRGSAGIMLLLGAIASINGFIFNKYEVVPYIAGFLFINFFIGVFINPKYSPTALVSRMITYNQSPLWIGAVQKRFAWSLGLGLSLTIFILSLQLLNDVTYFGPVCMLCLLCLLLLYLESAFGICVGCQLYHLAIRLKIIKAPEIKPNCMGDSCDV